jgi:rhodanese-related sulfurtransferase
MSRLLEYLSHHYWLGSVAGASLLAVLFHELREYARAEGSISAQEAVRLINQGATVIDVREAAAFAEGHIRGARNIPAGEVIDSTDSLKRLRERPVLVVCERGISAGAAMRHLQANGFTKVANLRGGLGAWRTDQLPLTRE